MKHMIYIILTKSIIFYVVFYLLKKNNVSTTCNNLVFFSKVLDEENWLTKSIFSRGFGFLRDTLVCFPGLLCLLSVPRGVGLGHHSFEMCILVELQVLLCWYLFLLLNRWFSIFVLGWPSWFSCPNQLYTFALVSLYTYIHTFVIKTKSNYVFTKRK